MRAIFERIRAVISVFQSVFRLQQWIAVALVGVVLMASGSSQAAPSTQDADIDSDVKTELQRLANEGEEGRPRTSGQWQAENEELQGKPGKQLKRIVRESADAVEEMSEIYPQNAKTLTPGVEDGKLPKDK